MFKDLINAFRPRQDVVELFTGKTFKDAFAPSEEMVDFFNGGDIQRAFSLPEGNIPAHLQEEIAMVNDPDVSDKRKGEALIYISNYANLPPEKAKAYYDQGAALKNL